MIEVKSMYSGELMCFCNSFSKAHEIAVSLRYTSVVASEKTGGVAQHYEVLRGDELLFDTRNGRVYA